MYSPYGQVPAHVPHWMQVIIRLPGGRLEQRLQRGGLVNDCWL